MKKFDRFVHQATSGRWILTVLAGASFFLFSIGLAYVIVKQRVEFKPETLVAMFSALLLVIQGVYKDYFSKNTDGEKTDSDDGLKDGKLTEPPPTRPGLPAPPMP